jgi:hypothetical protein
MSVKVDEDEHLEMHHYEDGAESDNAVKGIVLDRTGNVICHTSVYTHEYHITEVPGNIDWKTAVVLTAHEGTLLRVYYYNKWYVSTHKKLDSNKSRWGCKYSFRTLFDYALEDIYNTSNLDDVFYDKLDTNVVYTFLLRNNAYNRIVCDSPSDGEPKLYFTGSYTNTGFNDESVSSRVPIPTMDDWDFPIVNVERHYFTDFSQVEAAILTFDYKRVQGLLVFTPTMVFKIIPDIYLEKRRVRDNCSNMIFRYAQLRQTNPDLCNVLVDMFPTYSMDFSQFEHTLQKIAHHISTQYINRYVRKQYASVTPLQYKITKKLREWYLLDPINIRITPTVVLNFINSENFIYIYKLVTDFEQTV